MSEVPSLIVMIMSLRLQRERWEEWERMSLEGETDGEGDEKEEREWSGPERMSCHISSNPSSLALQTLHSLRMHNLCCPSNLPDEQESLTFNQSNIPHPHTLGPHGYLSWLGWIYLKAN